MVGRILLDHDDGMITSILFGLAIVVAPAVIVLASLALLGIVVATFADAAPEGLIRPTAS
jgi:hypothetical protein